MNKNTKKITRVEDTIEKIIDQSGVATTTQSHKEFAFDVETEPNYVKIYFDTVFTFKGLDTKGTAPILLAMLKRMTYANDNNPMEITLVSHTKKQIAKETGKSVQTIERVLREFVDHKIFFKVARSVYQANSQIFGKGVWKDIKKIRQLQARFDFVTGEMETEIEFEDENEKPPSIIDIPYDEPEEEAELNGQLAFNGEVITNDESRTNSQSQTNKPCGLSDKPW